MENLTIIPSVPIWKLDGSLFFDRKFHDGLLEYCNNWSGTVRLVIREDDRPPPAFGLVLFEKDYFPAELVILKQYETVSSQNINGASVVLASGDNHRNFHISSLCKNLGIKCIYVIEYILETRLQIIAMEHVNGWKKLKSSAWTLIMERERRKAFRLADGIQANGIPAYEKYKNFVSSPLLYFDSRNSTQMNISELELESRLSYLGKKQPLRLGFSGRLITMKGADHLIEVSYKLQKMNIPFTLDIFGAGELVPEIERKIAEYSLDDVVKLRGNVDFSKELMPSLKANIDVFICCHRQSDPSCTYLETYACGVPIVGYANRMHQGILEQAKVGWLVPMNDVNALAKKIVYVNRHRDEIRTKAKNARMFAAKHTFENTFNRRIEHCKKIVEE